MTEYKKIVTSLPFLRFLANLEQSGSRIPDGQSMKLILSLTLTLILQKRSSNTIYFLQKNADNSKIKRVLVLKHIFSEITCKCVLTCRISSFQHNCNKFQTAGEAEIPHPAVQNKPLINRLRLSNPLLSLLSLTDNIRLDKIPSKIK